MQPLAAIVTAILSAALPAEPPDRLRPPAYPLVTCDPYFSVWSTTDKLTDSWPRHWTGATMGMCGMVRVDGKAYRWCGMAPGDVPAAEQYNVFLNETNQTVYQFHAGPADLFVTFTSDLGDCSNIEQASRTAATVTVLVMPSDGGSHDIQTYFDVSGEWVVHDPAQQVTWTRHRIAGLDALSIGSAAQPVLATPGDARRIDWGRLYMVAMGNSSQLAAAPHASSRQSFVKTGQTLTTDDLRMPRAANDDYPVLAACSPGNLRVSLIYDDQYSIELFGRKLRPLWNQDGHGIERTIEDLKAQADLPIVTVDHLTVQDDPSLGTRSYLVAGPRYSQLLGIAYRQVLAANKIVADWDGTPLMFPKENTSNGCIATVDVIYPACPFFLYHSPEMLKAQLRPLMMYASSARWKFPFAPHDLGTYPKANGQVYGGGEVGEQDQMPVEESGNMLIMLAALAKVEGNAEFSRPYIPLLEKWANYLQEHGLDPATQLCTDDFAGHLSRNANLSAKTVVALGAYAQMLKTLGDFERSARWDSVARFFVKRWETLARDGDSTVLAFGNPGTWSQKYNLIWDRVLGLGLFEQEVFDRELTTYASKMQKYGLPLDSRKTYTKLDWTVWSACLTGRKADFDAVMSHVYTWVSETPTRVPLTDWYETTDGKSMGMHTRSVVGGMWMPMLMEKLGVGLK